MGLMVGDRLFFLSSLSLSLSFFPLAAGRGPSLGLMVGDRFFLSSFLGVLFGAVISPRLRCSTLNIADYKPKPVLSGSHRTDEVPISGSGDARIGEMSVL